MKPFIVAFLLSLACFAQDAKQTPKIFEIPTADVSTRYRYIDTNAGTVTADDLQYRFTGRFRVNVPKAGTYFGSRVETGSGIGSSWSNTGIGRSKSEWTLNAKTFFIGQQLGKQAAIEVGAMDMEQGAGTEATYADVDTWTEGYRLRVNGEGKYLPSKFTATFGFIGDFNTPNAFGRLYRLGEINYAQVLAEKKLTRTIRASAEYDRLRGIDLFRAATKMSLPDSWWINDLQVENVVRVAPRATSRLGAEFCEIEESFWMAQPGPLLLAPADRRLQGWRAAGAAQWRCLRNRQAYWLYDQIPGYEGTGLQHADHPQTRQRSRIPVAGADRRAIRPRHC